MTRLFCLAAVVVLLCSSFITSSAEEETCAEECKDSKLECSAWAKLNECEINPAFMLKACPKSCQICEKTTAEIDELIGLAGRKPPEVSKEQLTETPFGLNQIIQEGEHKAAQVRMISNYTEYMETIVFTQPDHASVREECKNRHADCSFWAVIGECEVNPNFMLTHCAPTCHTCHLLSYEARCPVNTSVPMVLSGKGDLNKLFERIVTDQYLVERYSPTIHSRPSKSSDIPWVVTLENFTTEQECDRLIQLGANVGYKRSKDVGSKNFDGTYQRSANDGRTSTNAWCHSNGCYNDTSTQRVLTRIENITGIPKNNGEYLQLLKYEEGQFYQTHHDYIPAHKERQQGVRIITVFLYLNDVEEGGGTNFPLLDITIRPKRGRALIWPSVLDENPNEPDGLTQHQALPSVRGIKYAANAWLHQRDVKEVLDRNC